MQTQKYNQQIRQLHHYVLAMVSVLVLFALTFPIACLRVSQSHKYGNAALKSLSWDEPQRPVTSYTSLVPAKNQNSQSVK
ncbi:hypothetical protein H6G33_02380 [Calothrix sp. FACHB-1219]|uniref:hypothetical protein n=1 Tax=unclassified Calothrix TaxID=2619626 RepID=UPI00168277AD|nr:MULTISPECIES: hypothetical protein [unclassified Calothrix]MBD2201452.1 hypothetical protein [Calothrix sp. FACHB-168]MBD2215884.1 hypothetical protein [Calothrix sp. FACHB-1219]